MQSGQRRKRKRFPKSSNSTTPCCCHCSRWWILLLLIPLLLAFFFFVNHSSIGFKPNLIVRRLSNSFSASSNDDSDYSGSRITSLRVLGRVLFPDHVLLLISEGNPYKEFDCVYHKEHSSNTSGAGVVAVPVLSVDDYDEVYSIARCPVPPSNYSVGLRRGGYELRMVDRGMSSWETVAYAAVLDGETAVVFVKGLNLRPDRVSDPTQFSCHFNWGDFDISTSSSTNKYALTTRAVTAAQEIVRCALPLGLQKYPEKAHGVRVSVRVISVLKGRRRPAAIHQPPLPSVAKLSHSSFEEKEKIRKGKYELCVCSMVWNQASSLREWIVYHSWIGVERWFIYDNNSDDDIKKVIDEIKEVNYNVTRHVWPWIKTQEAGFSHCALRARDECEWVAFMDVDEFFYFPFPTARNIRKTSKSELLYPGRNSLRTVVSNFSSSTTVGEIRTVCHSFGPSGLCTIPSQGVTAGYTCRLQSPERHKSIIRPHALDNTLLNVVHHFHLKNGYQYLNLPQNTAVINHYKYQVWDAFRAKFYRRVATYVTDWQENQNEGSKDRAPGLGTEAIEPTNWSLQFCEVWDTGLRDFVMGNLVDSSTGLLPWDKSVI